MTAPDTEDAAIAQWLEDFHALSSSSPPSMDNVADLMERVSPVLQGPAGVVWASKSSLYGYIINTIIVNTYTIYL